MLEQQNPCQCPRRHGSAAGVVQWHRGEPVRIGNSVVEHLDPNTTVVRFDVPGSGGSPDSPLPYGFPYLAAVLRQLLKQARSQHPARRCARIVVGWRACTAVRLSESALLPTAASSLDREWHHHGARETGCPGQTAHTTPLPRPRVRGLDRRNLYGGTVRTEPSVVKRLFDRQLMAGSRVGYLHQLLAASVWTSIFALPLIRQRTMVVAGLDDPVIPLANARILHRLLPHSTLHLHSGGTSI